MERRWDLWDSIRKKDRAYEVGLSRVAQRISAFGLSDPIEAGSTRLKINLKQSDLDVAVAANIDVRAEIVDQLKNSGEWTFIGCRQSTVNSSRYLFRGSVPGARVDLMIMPPADVAYINERFHAADNKLTEEQRIQHTWDKHRWYKRREIENYIRAKIQFYERWFPRLMLNRQDLTRDLETTFLADDLMLAELSVGGSERVGHLAQ